MPLPPKKPTRLYFLLEKLSNAYGISGAESEVRSIIIEEIKPFVDRVIVDKMGNVIAQHKGKGEHALLAAHMDEIGLLVREIDERGFLFVSAVGGVPPETLLATRVHIIAKNAILHGVVSCEQLHADLPMKKYPSLEKLYVDTGLSRKDLIRAGVSVGSPIIPEMHLAPLGGDHVVSGKALDNRTGCAVLLEAARLLRSSKHSITYLFTVQEEVGLYGAKTALATLNPAWAIAVDTTNAEDTTATGKGIGKGPGITIKDAEFIADPKLVERLQALAKKHRIPYQLEVNDVGTTDALSISLTRGGVPTAVLSIPVRNLHSTASIVHMGDLEKIVKLLHEMLR